MSMAGYIAEDDHSIEYPKEYTMYINLDRGEKSTEKTILTWHGKTYEANTSDIIRVLLDHSIFREVVL